MDNSCSSTPIWGPCILSICLGTNIDYSTPNQKWASIPQSSRVSSRVWTRSNDWPLEGSTTIDGAGSLRIWWILMIGACVREFLAVIGRYHSYSGGFHVSLLLRGYEARKPPPITHSKYRARAVWINNVVPNVPIFQTPSRLLHTAGIVRISLKVGLEFGGIGQNVHRTYFYIRTTLKLAHNPPSNTTNHKPNNQNINDHTFNLMTNIRIPCIWSILMRGDHSIT